MRMDLPEVSNMLLHIVFRDQVWLENRFLGTLKNKNGPPRFKGGPFT